LERVINPDPVPLRKVEYEQMDGELLHAMAELVELNFERFKKLDFKFPQSMLDVIESRRLVKALYRKKASIP